MVAEDLVLSCRRALEALRNGVPNRDAVERLGCNQPRAEGDFTKLLNRITDAENPPEGALGMLVSGDFGAGKSHLLTHLEHQALSRGFVCSKVAISKETPLYDLGKVFKSAVENGRMPGRRGRLIEELGQALKPSSDAYAAFFQWANKTAHEGLLSQMFPASLIVHERSNDLELNGEIEAFWGGERIRLARVKDGLRQIGQLQNYSFRAPKAVELPPQRLRFATELIKGAGYRGWVLAGLQLRPDVIAILKTLERPWRSCGGYTAPHTAGRRQHCKERRGAPDFRTGCATKSARPSTSGTC